MKNQVLILQPHQQEMTQWVAFFNTYCKQWISRSVVGLLYYCTIIDFDWVSKCRRSPMEISLNHCSLVCCACGMLWSVFIVAALWWMNQKTRSFIFLLLINVYWIIDWCYLFYFKYTKLWQSNLIHFFDHSSCWTVLYYSSCEFDSHSHTVRYWSS